MNRVSLFQPPLVQGRAAFSPFCTGEEAKRVLEEAVQEALKPTERPPLTPDKH